MSLRETITSFFGRRADERPASPDAGLIPAYEEIPMGLQNIVDAVKERRAPPPVKANGKDHHAEPEAPLFSTVNPNEARRATAWLEERIRLGARTGWMAQVVKITPVMAEIMLKRNIKNRALKPRAIGRYVRAMKDGRWFLTHEGIAYSTEGVLIDGQNRLTSIIEAGVTVEMPVFFGLEAKAKTVIDTGKTRTGSDVLRMADMPNAALMASMARMIKAIDEKIPMGFSIIDNNEIEAFIDAHPGMQHAATVGHTVGNALKTIPTSVAVAAYCIGRKHSEETVDAFFQKLKDGTFANKRDPMLLLRDKLKEGWFVATGSSEGRRIRIAGSIVKTWNAYLTKKNKRDISYEPNDEAFPEVM